MSRTPQLTAALVLLLPLGCLLDWSQSQVHDTGSTPVADGGVGDRHRTDRAAAERTTVDPGVRPDHRIVDILRNDPSRPDHRIVDLPRSDTSRPDRRPGLDLTERDLSPADLRRLETGLSRADAPVVDGGCGPGLVPLADGGCCTEDSCAPACSDHDACPSGLCHPLLRRCVPEGQSNFCSPCAANRECGLGEDICMEIFTESNGVLEHICGLACTQDVHCPLGLTCQFGGFCYPTPGVYTVHTCQAFRDTYFRVACNPSSPLDQCGLDGVNDGTCLQIFNHCSIGCSLPDDCPVGMTCTNLVISSFCI